MSDQKKVVIKTYAGNQDSAAKWFQSDSIKMAAQGYVPTSQSWAPGSYGCGAFILALLLCFILVGFLVFVYMLIVKPDGTLSVTYELRTVSVERDQLGNVLIDKEQRPTLPPFGQGVRTLENDAYKIYLVKQYKIEFNETLKKHIFNDALYESIDDALVAVHAFDATKMKRAEEEVEMRRQRELAKTSPPPNADAFCPNGNCSAQVRYDDPTCWKCSADFTHPQGWKPRRS